MITIIVHKNGSLVLMCMGALSCFPAISTKGDNFCDFLFGSLDDIALQKWGLLLNERICSKGANSFTLRVDPSLDER